MTAPIDAWGRLHLRPKAYPQQVFCKVQAARNGKLVLFHLRHRAEGIPEGLTLQRDTCAEHGLPQVGVDDAVVAGPVAGGLLTGAR